MPKLQYMVARLNFHHGSGCRCIKLHGAVCLFGKAEQFFLEEILQIQLHDLRCTLGIRQLCQLFHLCHGDLRNALRQEQTAIAAQTLHNRLAGRKLQRCISCAYIIHVSNTSIRDPL